MNIDVRYFSLLILLVLQGCDPSTLHDQYINNQSSYRLGLIAHNPDPRGYSSDTIIIDSLTQMEIYSRGGLGSLDMFFPCYLYADSLSIFVLGNDSLAVNKDINDADNWSYEIEEQNGRSGVCSCTLNLTNEHME